MSYDLYFYRKSNATEHFNVDTINEYFENSVPDIQQEDEDWLYMNDQTGATFTVVYFDPAVDWEDEESFVFDSFTATGMVLTIELEIPGAFAKEGFELAEKIMKELDLYIYNTEGELNSPVKYTAAELFNAWSADNSWLKGINSIK
jgi:hypothetical protein